MIKQGLKNYFQNLKFFFTPLGALALGFVFGLSITIPSIFSAIESSLKTVNSVLENVDIDLTIFADRFVSNILTLDWAAPIDSLKILFSREWLNQTLTDCTNAVLQSLEVYSSQIETAVTDLIKKIFLHLLLFIAFILLSLIGGFFLTKWLIRREIAKRALWKFFLASFVDALLNATLVSFCGWLLSLWEPSIFISTGVSSLLFGVISLFEAYIVHAWKKFPFKKILNWKNIGKLLLTDFLIFLLSVLFVGLILLLTNFFVGLFVGIAMAEIAFIVISLNAESYVKQVALTTAQ